MICIEKKKGGVSLGILHGSTQIGQNAESALSVSDSKSVKNLFVLFKAIG